MCAGLGGTQQNIKYETYFKLIIATGMRRGECCGLKWKDVDFTEKSIHICRNVVKVTGEDIIVKDPKTAAGDRYVYFSLEMASLLKEYRSFCQGELELHEGRELTLEDYIFRRHEMCIRDSCKAGKIDLILTKSVSRFARNVVDCISTVRMLSELSSPVGVFFESECIFSLKDDSQMALSFQATMAQEESHTRSRSMETSLRMRLDGGLPLTPKLLGYSHDGEGNLVVNPQEAPTVKLIFYLYLYGYSTSEIAEILTRQGRKTYLGNIKWTSNAVVQVLRNERHCGDVLTRKTFTPNYLTHKAKKNKGDRPQSLYRNHHEAIVSREDFIAVQHLLDNAKYGNKSFLPELRVVDQGLLRGFVVLHPRWAGFQPEDYLQASAAVHKRCV